MMLGGLGNLTNLLKVAKDLQGNMTRMQEELSRRRFEGDAGGGAVRAAVDGKLNVIDIKIDPSAVADVELLEDLAKSAVNAAIDRAREGIREEMSRLTGGVNVPGLSEMLGGGPST
jgi:hypothetical protein